MGSKQWCIVVDLKDAQTQCPFSAIQLQTACFLKHVAQLKVVNYEQIITGCVTHSMKKAELDVMKEKSFFM